MKVDYNTGSVFKKNTTMRASLMEIKYGMENELNIKTVLLHEYNMDQVINVNCYLNLKTALL